MRRLAAVLVAAGSVLAVGAVGPANAQATAPAQARREGPPDVDGAGSGERPGTWVAPSRAATALTLRYTSSTRVSPGVVARTFQTRGAGGPVLGHVLDVDLRNPNVRVGLLRPPVVAARRTVTAMANAQRAVAGVNGDFFNISATHSGVPATGAASGAEMDQGRPRKGAVPSGQRFGPGLPPTSSAEDVIGVDGGRVGHVSSLRVTGTIRFGENTLAVRGLNQYALPVGGAGVFTSQWGSVSRRRAVCGTDTARSAPCSTDTAEVMVRQGVVTKVSTTVGAGSIPKGTTVLVGREKAAATLRRLRPGDRVQVGYRLAGPHRFRFAIGGFRILRDAEPLAGLSTGGPAPRTAAGLSRNGRRLFLVVVDGRSERSGGVTLAELARLLRETGADDAVNLDGGGSSTFALRRPGAKTVTVRNSPSDGVERPVANGIGIFANP